MAYTHIRLPLGSLYTGQMASLLSVNFYIGQTASTLATVGLSKVRQPLFWPQTASSLAPDSPYKGQIASFWAEQPLLSPVATPEAESSGGGFRLFPLLFHFSLFPSLPGFYSVPNFKVFSLPLFSQTIGSYCFYYESLKVNRVKLVPY
jgi:hypothetical protein